MSDYRRLISYIYSYEKGIKMRNSGFARVESQGGVCKINISLRISEILINDTSDHMLEVFMFARRNGKVHKTNIGRIRIINGNSIFRGQFDAGKIGNGRLPLSDIVGIFICSRNFLNRNSQVNIVYASEWDDTTIFVDEFTDSDDIVNDDTADTMGGTDTAQLLNDENMENRTEISGNVNMDTLIDEAEIGNHDQNRNEENLNADINQNDKKDGQETIDITENEGYNNIADKVSAVNDSDINKIRESTNHNIDETIQNQNIENVKMYEKQLQKILERSDNNVKQQTAGNTVQNMSVNDNRQMGSSVAWTGNQSRTPDTADYFRMLCNCYPKIKVEELAGECIRIAPHDITYLPKKYWHLCNNSFLLHAYYSYRYILLCEENNDEGKRYMICVPGMMQKKEQAMAGMYGFTKFESKEQSELKNFGYWCMYL